MADPVADAFLKQVDLVETDLVGLARAIPADGYDFRPSGGASRACAPSASRSRTRRP